MSRRYQILHITILLASLRSLKAASINVTNANTTQIDTVEEIKDANETVIPVEELKKEKDDLFIQINKAIDEAIPELERTNDTEANAGIVSLKTLKQQMKEIHEASDSDDNTNEMGPNNTNSEFRRKLSINIGQAVHLLNKDTDRKGGKSWIQKMRKNEFEKKWFESRDNKFTSLPRVINRQKIAEQIQAWLLKQQEEKQKRKELRVRLKMALERCPDFGRGKDKKKTAVKKASHYFPCCRKCCKKSYLGCL